MKVVMKFGGSSVKTADRIENVVNIIQNARKRRDVIAVVCSAIGGATDHLIKTASLARNRDESYKREFEEVKQRHMNLIEALLESESSLLTRIFFEKTFLKLEDVLHGVYLVRELTDRTLDFVMSFGERLSNFLVAQILIARGCPAAYLDARDLIQTNDHFGSALVNLPRTQANLKSFFHDNKEIQIVTGFIGSTEKGETTTLGRGGSDYSASLIGAALDVDEVEIWTDVDGVMTADPGKVPAAFALTGISFEEAMEMSHFGAKVIYPPTMAPVMVKKIPIRIKNTFNPEGFGTLISEFSGQNASEITGISSIDQIALLQLKGCGLIGVSGIAARLFGALARKKINVIMISQASSEHAICAVIPPECVNSARNAIDEEFALEIGVGQVEPVFIQDGYSIVAVVGEQMRLKPGLAGRVFSALGQSGVNVSAIAQGSSERNISLVVHSGDETKSLRVIHDRFFQASTERPELQKVYLAGPGQVGRVVLELLETDPAFSLGGIISSRNLWLDPGGLKLPLISDQTAQPFDKETFLREIKSQSKPPIFVDCTASEDWMNAYSGMLEAGIPIVTPNKKAVTGNIRTYRNLSLSRNFFFEANVGAGLPLISTIRTLIRSGDRVKSIQAVLSGTLSYLFNEFNGEKPFSQLLRCAKSLGLTEPHPGDDLNGMDAGRKILILARLCGADLELSDVHIENLVPEPCRSITQVDSFLEAMGRFDVEFEKRRCDSMPCKLRYLAEFDGQNCTTGLKAVASEHPAYNLIGTDNMVIIHSERYHQTPLVIRGPGAGLQVTAGQVFAEIREARELLRS